MAAKSKPKSNGKAMTPVVLNQAINIPLNKLVLSEDNVRKTNADDKAAIAALAEGIGRRSLLQSLSVRPVLDGDGTATGTYEVPGGGRRLRALQLLVKQKRLADDVPVPCVVKTDGNAVEDSLAENSDREDLHPLDEFRAFEALAAGGKPDADIGAAFGVTTAVVRQRRRLASVSDNILEAYGADEVTLDCVMAFTITEDRARQEQVFKSLRKSQGGMQPWQIRKLLTETTVEASDRRARFVGLDTYREAGGVVMRDLFENDEGGWLQDPVLLQRLVDEKLAASRDAILAKGWKWVEAAVEISYGVKNGMLRLKPTGDALSKKDTKLREKLSEEFDELNAQDGDDVPDKVRSRLDELETAIAEMDNRPEKYAAEDIARAGAFISLDYNGHLSCEYGFVRSEDAPAVSEDAIEGDDTADDADDADGDDDGETEDTEVAPAEETGKPLSERLVQDLTSYRTVALRDALAQDFGTAFVSVLHAMCLGLFYHASTKSCLQVSVNDSFPAQAPDLAEWGPAKTLDARHKSWTAELPRKPEDLWQALVDMTDDKRASLFAHCASRSVNAVRMPKNSFQSRNGALAHANTLAAAVGLDMVRAGWVNTVDTYLGRVTKDHIVEAVREAKGDNAAQLIDHLKKDAMAQEAERLLAGTGWLPQALRMPDQAVAPAAAPAEDLPAFLNEGEGAERPAAA